MHYNTHSSTYSLIYNKDENQLTFFTFVFCYSFALECFVPFPNYLFNIHDYTDIQSHICMLSICIIMFIWWLPLISYHLVYGIGKCTDNFVIFLYSIALILILLKTSYYSYSCISL